MMQIAIVVALIVAVRGVEVGDSNRTTCWERIDWWSVMLEAYQCLLSIDRL